MTLVERNFRRKKFKHLPSSLVISRQNSTKTQSWGHSFPPSLTLFSSSHHRPNVDCSSGQFSYTTCLAVLLLRRLDITAVRFYFIPFSSPFYLSNPTTTFTTLFSATAYQLMKTMMNTIEPQYRQFVSVSSSSLATSSSSFSTVSHSHSENSPNIFATALLLSSLLLSCCCPAPPSLSTFSTTAPLIESSTTTSTIIFSSSPVRSLLLGLFYCFFHYQSDDSTISRFQEAISTSQYPSTDFFVMDYFYFDYYYFIKK